MTSRPFFSPWWDDAITLARALADQTMLRHKVTAVRDTVEGEVVIVGWLVDLADGEHRRAAATVDAEFWAIVGTPAERRSHLDKTIAGASSPEPAP
ncbi:hypothetical protein [Nocardioides sp.]|uniref:hypothetical protein n=1 Tax=Nocardioides sp. TaxID=35761 RepID=UPI002634611C|nr:hypothetical protein [Nocardioides sp.]MDI6911454.1 hypothetical protein [Nocardioides sp.]